MTDAPASTFQNEARNNEAFLHIPKMRGSADMDGDDDAAAGEDSTSSIKPVMDDHGDDVDSDVDPNADLVGDSDLEDDAEAVINVTVEQDDNLSNKDYSKLLDFENRAPSIPATSGQSDAARTVHLLKVAKQREDQEKRAKQKEEENKKLIARKKEEEEKALIAKKKKEEDRSHAAGSDDASSASSSSVSLTKHT